jgi:hypothetical protein
MRITWHWLRHADDGPDVGRAPQARSSDRRTTRSTLDKPTRTGRTERTTHHD